MPHSTPSGNVAPGRFRRLSSLTALAVTLALLATPAAAPPAAAATVSCTAVTPIDRRPTLRAGDSGSCVRTLKNLLLTKGWTLHYAPPVAAFDAATTTMLANWQTAMGRPVRAVVDADTWRAIADTPAKSGYTIDRGPYDGPKVVLSFDDCPRSYSSFKAAVLAAESLGIALALFPTGACLRGPNFSASYARAHGHYVFNHSVNHPRLTQLSASKVYAELGSPGVVTNYGRPPYGLINAAVAKVYASRNMRPWLWTYDTEDWTGLSRDTVVARVINNATPGSTILMHMQHAAFNPTALRAIVTGLAGRKLTACGNYPGTTPQKPATFRC